MVTIIATAFACSAEAGTHKWIPRATAQGAGADQSVVITATSINWGDGIFDSPFGEVATTTVSGGNGIASAIEGKMKQAVKLSRNCSNPLIAANLQTVTGADDATDRFLSASAMFTSIQQSNLWASYNQAYGGIKVLVNGQYLSGFKVYYADGASETWVVTPNANFSVAKLFDTPAPGSLTPGKPGQSCANS